MADTTHDEHHGVSVSGSEHISDPKVLWTVWFILMILLGLTFAASTQDFGRLNLVIAVLIAVVKTALVVLYFMGVKYNTKLTWLWASLGFIWMLLLFGTMGDYITREWVRLPEGW
jgi:cytochrome c oxidase subunit IV